MSHDMDGKKKQVFTDEELKEMGTPTVDLIKAAVDKGDEARAKVKDVLSGTPAPRRAGNG